MSTDAQEPAAQQQPVTAIIVGMVVAAIVGYLSIRFFLKLIANAKLEGFAFLPVTCFAQALAFFRNSPDRNANRGIWKKYMNHLEKNHILQNKMLILP